MLDVPHIGHSSVLSCHTTTLRFRMQTSYTTPRRRPVRPVRPVRSGPLHVGQRHSSIFIHPIDTTCSLRQLPDETTIGFGNESVVCRTRHDNNGYKHVQTCPDTSVVWKPTTNKVTKYQIWMGLWIIPGNLKLLLLVMMAMVMAVYLIIF